MTGMIEWQNEAQIRKLLTLELMFPTLPFGGDENKGSRRGQGEEEQQEVQLKVVIEKTAKTKKRKKKKQI